MELDRAKQAIAAAFQGRHALTDYDEHDQGRDAIAQFVLHRIRQAGIEPPVKGAIRILPHGIYRLVDLPLNLPNPSILKIKISTCESRRPTTHFNSKAMIQLARGQVPYETQASITIHAVEITLRSQGAANISS
jgi:hypothetical protein